MQINNIKPEANWVNVDDRLPRAGKQYLCFTNKGYIQIRIMNARGFPEKNGHKITHWMPIPDVPND